MSTECCDLRLSRNGRRRLKMIKIEIDSESDPGSNEARSLTALTAVKVGLLSSIKDNPEYQNLLAAFESGLGVQNIDKELADGDSYDKSKLKEKRTKLKRDKNCKVIATAGGSV